MTINIKDDEIKQNVDCDNVKEMRNDLECQAIRNMWINMFLERLNSKLFIIVLFLSHLLVFLIGIKWF